ncbi:UNVERIFIED_CONTAM: hypothetical protein ABIC26_002886 [Paenibacillus sp. PvR008]
MTYLVMWEVRIPYKHKNSRILHYKIRKYNKPAQTLEDAEKIKLEKEK